MDFLAQVSAWFTLKDAQSKFMYCSESKYQPKKARTPNHRAVVTSMAGMAMVPDTTHN